MAETQQIIKGLLPSGKTPSTQKAEILELISQNTAQVGIPIFPTLAEAQAWEAKNPGKTALTTEPQTPDTAPPTAGTLAVTPSNTSAMLTVTGARDDRTVAGYSFRIGSGAWSPWQASASYTATGLTPTTGYTFTHRVKDAAENITAGSPVQATTTATPALKPGDIFTSDTFTGTGSLVGQMTSAALGGTPVKWEGAAGMVVEGGKAVAGASAAGKAILAAGLADVKLEFTLVARPTSGELGITLRDALNVNRNIRIGIGPSLLRVQRYDPAGSTVIPGAQTVLGPASDGTKITVILKGEKVTVTGQGNVNPYTIDVTDSVVLGPGAITVSAPAGSGAAIDDLVVTAQ